MNTHDFIFSKKWKFERHLGFWLFWYLYFVLSYYIPHYTFPGWKINWQAIHQAGWPNFLGNILLNSLSLMSSLAVFTYFTIYFLLPRYFLKGKYLRFAFGLILMLGVVTLLVRIEYLWYNFYIFKAFTGISLPLDESYINNCTFSFILFNLSSVTGVALVIKLVKRWYLKQLETDQAAREKTRVELELLKAQVHPHFLFNSLNNIYSYSLESSPKAPELISRLMDLLHYIIHECNEPEVDLEKELKIINDYIELEKVRYGSRLHLDIRIRPDLAGIHHAGENGQKGVSIVPLLLLPFLENSFKHGTSKVIDHPRISMDVIWNKDYLHFRLENTKPMENAEHAKNGNGGLGLKNVRKRLGLLYAAKHRLEIADGLSNYAVDLQLALGDSKALFPLIDQKI